MGDIDKNVSIESSSSVGKVSIPENTTKGKLEPRMSILSLKTSGTDSGDITPKIPLLRRRSTLKSLTHSMMGMRRKSIFHKEPAKPKIRYENTFKLKPDEGHEFSSTKVKDAMLGVIEIYLKDVKYDQRKVKMLCCTVSEIMNKKISAMGYSRHKIVCNVIIGQRQDQGIKMASRCLWDPDTDDWASVEFQNDSLFAIATIHGIYST